MQSVSWKSGIAVFLLLFLGLASCFAAGTADTDRQVSIDGQTAIFAIADVWPWGYEGADDKPSGMLAQLAERLAAVVQVPLSSRLRPHRRAILELASGAADFVPLFESPQNDEAGIRVGLITTVRVLLTGMVGSPKELTIEGMSGQSVGYIRGTYYGDTFAHDELIEKIPVNSLEQAVEMLQLGRIDAIVSSDQALYHTLLAMHLPVSQFRTDTIIARQAAWLYMSRNAPHPELLQPIRVALHQLNETGELARIFQQPE